MFTQNTQMFIVCLFIITKTQEPKCPSLFMEYMIADDITETDLRGLTLSEKSQSQKITYRLCT